MAAFGAVAANQAPAFGRVYVLLWRSQKWLFRGLTTVFNDQRTRRVISGPFLVLLGQDKGETAYAISSAQRKL